MHFLSNWFIRVTGFIPMLIGFRFKTYYEDKKIQSRRIRGKAIVIANHRSLYDFALMIFLFPFRTLRCVIGEVMFKKNVFLTFLLRALGGIKVEREQHDFTFVGKCKRVLVRGGVVEIYPESKLNKTDETLLPFKPSFVYLALECGAPIIPVYTDGNYFKKRAARVIIGKPVDVFEFYDDNLSDKENITNITEIIRGKVLALKDELDRQSKEKG